jgi:signal peptidase I
MIRQTGPTKTKLITYTGPSMNPTLKAGDRLEVIPYESRKIRPGDVIVFLSPENGTKITHRVVSIGPDGVKTQGDRNISADPWALSPDRILGRVIYVQKGTRKRRILGGRIGLIFATTFRALRVADTKMSSVLQPAYSWLVRSGVFTRWLSLPLKPRILSFKRQQGRELQLLLGRRTIGRWLPGKSQWHIRRPFRLLVDEAALPENLSESIPSDANME